MDLNVDSVNAVLWPSNHKKYSYGSGPNFPKELPGGASLQEGLHTQWDHL